MVKEQLNFVERFCLKHHRAIMIAIALLGVLFFIQSVAPKESDYYYQTNPESTVLRDGKCVLSLSDCQCVRDCETLDKAYYRYNPGGFANSECWCREGNTTFRVW